MKTELALKQLKTFSEYTGLLAVKDNSEELARIEKEFDRQLPDDLREYVHKYAPAESIDFESVGNCLQLYAISELAFKQDGYNFNSVLNETIEDWPSEYFIIGSEGADPIVYDMENLEIIKLEHGTGDWENGEIVADSIGQFLLCCSAMDHALTAFEDEAIVDDENGFCLAPDAAKWLFPKMKKWAGDYYDEWCSILENS